MVGAFFYERGDTMARSELSRLRHNLYSKIYYYNRQGYDIDSSFVKDMTEEQLQNYTTEDLLREYGNQYEEEQEYEEEYEDEDEYEDEYEDEWYYPFPGNEDMIFKHFLSQIEKYSVEAQNYIRVWLDRVRAERGDGAVAQMLQDAANDGLEITSRDIYGDIDACLVKFLDYLPEGFEFEQDERDALLESVLEQYAADDWGY